MNGDGSFALANRRRPVNTFPERRKEAAEMAKGWTIEELHSQLARFEAELVAAGLSPGTVHTYVDRSERFLRWLNGDYVAGQGLGGELVRSKRRG